MKQFAKPWQGAIASIRMASFAFILLAHAFTGAAIAQTASTGSPSANGRNIISYQGVIAGTDGTTLNGNQWITVTLYGDDQGKSEVWRGTYSASLANGVFNIALGSGAYPLPSSSAMDKPLWAGVRLAGKEELRPLSQLTAASYAMNVADNSITQPKMGTEYVGSISVNGQRVSSKGEDVNFVAGNGLEMTIDPGTRTVMVAPSANSPIGKGDKTLTVVGSGGITNMPGCTNSDGGFSKNTVSGGCGNTANPSTGYATISGGSGNTVQSTYSNIGGGNQNAINSSTAGASQQSVIAGGYVNVIDGVTTSGIGSGHNNRIDQNYTGGNIGMDFIGGGEGNIISTSATPPPDWGSWSSAPFMSATGQNDVRYATISGGAVNYAFAELSGIGSGWNNTTIGGSGSAASFIGGGTRNIAYGFDAAIGGGGSNDIEGDFSAIPGGLNLRLGESSFGFNANLNTDTHYNEYNPIDLTAAAGPSGVAYSGQIAYFGDVDIWLGNYATTGSTATPTKLKFWQPNHSLDYTGGAHYSAFQASSTAQSDDILYTLPSTAPTTSGQFLRGTSTGSSGPNNVTLEWATVSSSSSGITSLNSQTGSSQTMVTGTTGTDFNISSSGNVHTFNLPDASATGRGALTAADWTLFNSKEHALTFSNGLTRSANNVVLGGALTGNTTITTSGSIPANLTVDGNGIFSVSPFTGLGTAMPNEQLEVSGNIRIDNGTNFSTFTEPAGTVDNIHYTLPATTPTDGEVLTATTGTPTTLKWAQPTVSGANVNGLDPDKVTFGTHGATPTHASLAQDGNFVYTSSGDLGVGTSSPLQRLDVNGHVIIEGGNKLMLQNSGNTNSSTFASSSGSSVPQIDYILPSTPPTGTNNVLTAGSTSSPITLTWAPPTTGTTFNGWLLNGNLINTPQPQPLLGTKVSSDFDLWLISRGDLMGLFDRVNSNVTLGYSNTITVTGTAAASSTIGGGITNGIGAGATSSTIAGGASNNITSGGSSGGANSATIGGGGNNQIRKDVITHQMLANFATIPGGQGLLANSFGQTAVGTFNNTKATNVIDLSLTSTGGSVAPDPQSATNNGPLPPLPFQNTDLSNGILFAVGNGTGDLSSSNGKPADFGTTAIGSATSGVTDSGYRHNAFEVSYNGHATPTGVLGEAVQDPIAAHYGSIPANVPVVGTGPNSIALDQGNAPVKGAYYNDNSLLAWGDIPVPTGLFDATHRVVAVTPTGSFGVVSAVWYWPDMCVITTNYYPGHQKSSPSATDSIDPEYAKQAIVASLEDYCDPNIFSGFLTVSPWVPSSPTCDAPMNRNQFRVTTWTVTPTTIHTIGGSTTFTGGGFTNTVDEIVPVMKGEPRAFYFHMTGR